MLNKYMLQCLKREKTDKEEEMHNAYTVTAFELNVIPISVIVASLFISASDKINFLRMDCVVTAFHTSYGYIRLIW